MSANEIKYRTVISLKEQFTTGGSHPKDQRIYPAGTRGVVFGRNRHMLYVEMDDPHGVVYQHKLIAVNKDSVRV